MPSFSHHPPCHCAASIPAVEPQQTVQLGRRQLIGAAALLGCMPGPSWAATSCAPELAAAAPAPRDVCVECLVRRAQQRSVFVNREAA